ncbi:MAG TPA: Xaa-Pro peptidase family protein [Gaiellales bacterium]|jgi:Xaa-Pro aminopeptidase|nr:Xaa-Pro peptidase family protein [Gaiellales bacterium]
MRSRATRALEAVACDAFVASDPYTVTWLTGFAADETWGPNPFSAPPLAVVRSDGSVVAIVSEDEAPELEGGGSEILAYEGFTTGPLDVFAARRAALASLRLRGRVAVEDGCLPVPGAEAVQADAHALRLLRAVKDDEEIARIRAAIRICDAGQAAARSAVRSGASEIEAWGEVQSTMQVAAGGRLSLLCDFATGERSAEGGGPPTSRIVRDGELAIVDLVPRLGGYFGDSCSTIALGRVPAEVRSAHARCSEALEHGLAALAPGLVARDVDALVREGLDYPHHSGHGVGVAPNEEPRIVPAGDTVLAPGMVVALEPGAYPGPWGLRVERVALVTETGCEILSTHDLSL